MRTTKRRSAPKMPTDMDTTVADIWLHHHRHGVSVYPMFRLASQPVHPYRIVVQRHDVDFEPERDECFELSVTSVPVPTFEDLCLQPFSSTNTGELTE